VIRGQFQTCIRFGPQPGQTIAPTSGFVVNTTCRLNGTEGLAPQAAFDVAAMRQGTFVNLIVEVGGAAPLFRAQADGLGARVAPVQLLLDRTSIVRRSANFDGFTDLDGTYSITVDDLEGDDPLFVSPTDSALVGGAQPIDTGRDPNGVDPSLTAGTAIDGTSRVGRVIDRGAYEQGQ
jgi:hypothetical protein